MEIEVEGTNGIKVSYSSEITFTGKKAKFAKGDIKVYAADGSEISFRREKVKKANKVGDTTFKITGAKITDKKIKKAFKKAKFPVTIVPYEVTEKDNVDVQTNANGKIKKVIINNIKLKKSEYSIDSAFLTFSGRFRGSILIK